MSEKYKIRDNDQAYFVTMTVVGWIGLNKYHPIG